MPDLMVVLGDESLAVDVAEAAQMAGFTIRGFLISGNEPLSVLIRAFDLPIEPLSEWLQRPQRSRVAAVVAASEGRERQRLVQYVQSRAPEMARVIHPTAQVSASAELSTGSIVLAGAVVHTGVHLGKHCVVGSLASIDHDCRLQGFIDVESGAHLAGGCTVGRFVHIGIGASVGPQLTIGEDACIEAGAAVITNVPGGAKFAGVPAVDTRT